MHVCRTHSFDINVQCLGDLGHIYFVIAFSALNEVGSMHFVPNDMMTSDKE
jgi:hypothetical protein